MSFIQLILFSSFTLIVMCHLIEKRHIDFQERFMERRRQREMKDQVLLTMENEVLNDIEVVNEVTHYLKNGNKSSKKWKKIETIERDFRRLLAMDGMKYHYKRDFYWRTWRRVASHSGTDEIVCYKCNNIVQAPGCQNCGMWTIEERPPPCPYEFFSVINDKQMCGAYYTQFTDMDTSCPSIINFSDLTSTCDNPIETKWRFTKMYVVPENQKNKNIICGNEDSCEIYTSYEITPDYVIFRIINSTNDVIYSRIMRPHHKNYICIDDCGRFNQNTRKIIKSDIPLKLNLLATKVNENIGEKIAAQSKNNFLIELNNTITTPLATTAVFSVIPPLKVNKVSKSPSSNTISAKVIDNSPFLLEHRIKPRVTKRQQNDKDLQGFLKKHFFPKFKLFRWQELNDTTLDSFEVGSFNSTGRNFKISRWRKAETRIISVQ